jgi:hypothetical protein
MAPARQIQSLVSTTTHIFHRAAHLRLVTDTNREVTIVIDTILLICKIGGIGAAVSIGVILLGIALGKINV